MIFNTAMDAVKDLKSSDIPVFIPSFNTVTYVKNMVQQLEDRSIENIIICDNNSTYEPMINYLNEISKTHKVVLWQKNLGPRLYSEAVDLINILPEYYIVTDPDLILNKNMPENFMDEMISISDKCSVSKVGTALDIFSKEQNEKFFDAEKVRSWEFGYWENKIEIPEITYKLYVAPVDTTFAMVSKERIIRDIFKYHGYSSCLFPAIRVGGPFTAKHMGWWKDLPLTKEEYLFYRKTHIWSCTEKFKDDDVSQ